MPDTCLEVFMDEHRMACAEEVVPVRAILPKPPSPPQEVLSEVAAAPAEPDSQ